MTLGSVPFRSKHNRNGETDHRHPEENRNHVKQKNSSLQGGASAATPSWGNNQVPKGFWSMNRVGALSICRGILFQRTGAQIEKTHFRAPTNDIA